MGCTRLFSQLAACFCACELLVSCSSADRIAVFKNNSGETISVNLSLLKMKIIDKEMTLSNCSTEQVICYKADGYAVAFPKKCSPIMSAMEAMNFDESIGYAHAVYISHSRGYSRVHGPKSRTGNYLFGYDHPKVIALYYAKNLDLVKIMTDEQFGWQAVEAYTFKHVEGSYTLGCSSS